MRWTGGSGIFKQTFVGTLCLDVKGATSLNQVYQHPRDRHPALCLGHGLPGRSLETGRPRRSFDLALYPGAGEVEKDGRLA